MSKRGISEWLALTGSGIIKVGDFLSSYIFLGLMVLLMALDPFMRYLVGSPFYWSNEVTTYLMVMMVFNGFGIALVKKKHIRVTLIFDRMSPKVQSVMWVITSLVGLLYVSFMGYALLRLTISSFEYRVRSATAEMLTYPWQIMVMVGMVMFWVAMLLVTVKKIAMAAGLDIEETIVDE